MSIIYQILYKITQKKIIYKIRQISILIIPLLFSSCIFLTENSIRDIKDTNIFFNRFPDNYKSIIIFKIDGKRNSKIRLCPQKDFDNKNYKNCQIIYTTNNYRILMLEPGQYYIEALPYYFTILQKNYDKVLLSFKTDPRKIFYLGDIKIRHSLSFKQNFAIKVTIQDNFDEIMEIFTTNDKIALDKKFFGQILEAQFLLENHLKWQDLFVKNIAINLAKDGSR